MTIDLNDDGIGRVGCGSCACNGCGSCENCGCACCNCCAAYGAVILRGKMGAQGPTGPQGPAGTSKYLHILQLTTNLGYNQSQLLISLFLFLDRETAFANNADDKAAIIQAILDNSAMGQIYPASGNNGNVTDKVMIIITGLFHVGSIVRLWGFMGGDQGYQTYSTGHELTADSISFLYDTVVKL